MDEEKEGEEEKEDGKIRGGRSRKKKIIKNN